MGTVVVQIVVVTSVESGAGTRRPTKQRLRTQPGIEGVVIENHSSERRFCELISAAQGQDVDLEGVPIRVVTLELLAVDAERRAQLVCRLVRHAAVELEQTAASRIERSLLAQQQRRRTNARIFTAAAAEVEIHVSPTMCYLPVELNLLTKIGAGVKRQMLFV